MIILYGIPNCDTVKKARAWLTARGIAHEFYDFKKRGVPADRLPIWAKAAGWDKLINRQGSTWRKLDPDAQASASQATGAQALVLANPSVIKRPVVDWGADAVTVGFDEKSWEMRL
jgi:arsenate reductase